VGILPAPKKFADKSKSICVNPRSSAVKN